MWNTMIIFSSDQNRYNFYIVTVSAIYLLDYSIILVP
jgi:hypothetical protein